MIGFREFYVKVRKDIDPEAEMKKHVRERGLVQFSPEAFSRKKAYPVLAVDVDTESVEGLAGGAHPPASYLPGAGRLWIRHLGGAASFFHYAGFKNKKN